MQKADILRFAHLAMDLVHLQICDGIFESEQQDHQMRLIPGTKSGVIHPIDLILAGMALVGNWEEPPRCRAVLILSYRFPGPCSTRLVAGS